MPAAVSLLPSCSNRVLPAIPYPAFPHSTPVSNSLPQSTSCCRRLLRNCAKSTNMQSEAKRKCLNLSCKLICQSTQVICLSLSHKHTHTHTHNVYTQCIHTHICAVTFVSALHMRELLCRQLIEVEKLLAVTVRANAQN